MMLKRTLRVCLASTAVSVLVGCSQDPEQGILERRVYDQRTELSAVNVELSQAQAHAEQLTGQVARLEGERNRAQAELGAAQVSADALAGHLGLNSSGLKLGGLLSALGSAYADRDAAQAAAERTEAKPAELANEARAQQAEDAAQYLSEQLQLLAAERDALHSAWEMERQQAMAATHAMQSALAEQHQAVEEIYARDEEIDFLHEQLESIYQHNLTLQADVEKGSGSDTVANKSDAEDVARLSTETERLKQGQDYLYELFEARNTALRESQSTLKSERDKAADMAAALADVSAERDALQTQINAVTAELNSRQGDLEAAQRHYEELAAANPNHAKQQQQTADLKRQVKVVAAAAGEAAQQATAAAAEAAKREQALTHQIEALQADFVQFKQGAQSLSKQQVTQIGELEAALASEQAGVANAAEREQLLLQQGRKLRAALNGAKQSADAADAKNQAELATQKQATADAQARNEGLQAELESLQAAAKQARAKLQRTRAELTTASTALASSNAATQAARDEIKPMIAQRDELIKHLSVAHQKVAEVEAKLSTQSGN